MRTNSSSIYPILFVCLFVCVLRPINSEVIYCPLRRTRRSVNTPFQPGIEPRAVAWWSITLPLRHASSLSNFECFAVIIHEVMTVSIFLAQQITTKTDLRCLEKLGPVHTLYTLNNENSQELDVIRK